MLKNLWDNLITKLFHSEVLTMDINISEEDFKGFIEETFDCSKVTYLLVPKVASRSFRAKLK